MKKILMIILSICILICPALANTEELLSVMGIIDNLDSTAVTRPIRLSRSDATSNELSSNGAT